MKLQRDHAAPLPLRAATSRSLSQTHVNHVAKRTTPPRRVNTAEKCPNPHVIGTIKHRSGGRVSRRNRKQRAIKMTDEHNWNTSAGKWDIFCLSARGKKERNGSCGAGRSFCGSMVNHSGHITCTHALIRIKLPARCDTASIRGC